MNKVTLRGRVGSEPEFRTLNGGGRVCSFRLATEESWKSGDEWKKRTTWHTAETFREADQKTIEAHVSKGDLVMVEGMIRVEEYTDKDQVKRTAFKIATTDCEHGIYPDPRGRADRGE